MDNRGYTITLAIILALIGLITCLLVLIILLLTSRQGPLVALPQPATPVVVVQPTLRPPVNVEPTLVMPSPTNSPVIRATPLLVVLPTATPLAVTATPTSIPSPTRPRATPTPTGPTPTPTYPSNIQFIADGPVRPDTVRGCLGGSIFGTVRDLYGKPMAGVRVKIYNQYLSDISRPSKPVDAPDAGFYDVILNTKPATWKVVVVDGGGNPISPEVEVVHPVGMDVCHFQVDWKAVR